MTEEFLQQVPARTADEFMRPVRAQDRGSDVGVPLLQAAVDAAAIGALGAALIWCLVQVGGGRLTVAETIGVAGLVLIPAFAWRWFARSGDARALLWVVETALRRDLDDDKVVGKPAAPALMTVNAETARATAAADERAMAREAERTALIAFVRRCEIQGCSEAAQGVTPPTRAEYLQRRDLLIRLGIGKWRDPARPKLGWTLGCSVFKAERLIRQHVV